MSNYDLLYIERRAIDSAAYYEREKGSAIYEEHTLAYGMGARWMEKELQAKVKWFDQILSGNSKKLVKENEELQAKVKRLEDKYPESFEILKGIHVYGRPAAIAQVKHVIKLYEDLSELKTGEHKQSLRHGHLYWR